MATYEKYKVSCLLRFADFLSIIDDIIIIANMLCEFRLGFNSRNSYHDCCLMDIGPTCICDNLFVLSTSIAFLVAN